MSFTAKKAEASLPDPICRALDHFLAEYDRARADKLSAESRLAGINESIQGLITALSTDKRDDYQRRYAKVKVGSLVRGGDTFGNVISLFQRFPNRSWTAPQVQEALRESGVEEEDAKAISNAIAYLAKSGRLQRISRGQYVMAGYNVGVEYDEAHDGQSRLTEHDF